MLVLCINVNDCLKRLLISPSEAAGLAGNTENFDLVLRIAKQNGEELSGAGGLVIFNAFSAVGI